MLVKQIQQIINRVKKEKDRALIFYTRKFDGVNLTPAQMKVTVPEFTQALKEVNPQVRQSMISARKNIEQFSRLELRKSWTLKKQGIILGQKIVPLESVGVYVPGGRFPYFSTVLMCAVPARVAGVKRIVVVTPPSPEGKINPYILTACSLVGIKEVYKVGGAQAISALTYGTPTIPRVDKIVGPGNIYVTLAKKLLFGEVGIDLLAGPSEVLILADSSANPEYVGQELKAQAEHDPRARGWLVSLSKELALKVRNKLNSNLQKQVQIITVNSLAEGMKIINQRAPEHLVVILKNDEPAISKIKNAGTIFIGPYSPVALGDYWAGPSHVLPTDGTSRFSSGLGVESFQKKINLIRYSQPAFKKVSKDVFKLARTEGLIEHARSLEIRK